MLPSLVAHDIEAGLRSYVSREFPVATQGFMKEGKSVIDRFLEEPESLTKGPWAEVSLPFRKAAESDALPFVKLDVQRIAPRSFPPYQHQLQAFERLTGEAPQSTIVATGTGSGKTECFLFPLLDYCLKERRQGIKAIIIYPMNALASDQEKRLAKLLKAINQPLPAKDRLTAGLYTGDDVEKSVEMTDDRLVSDRNKLRENPPDILLTNYKMLDFLLMRPEDQPLWKGADKVMKFLVVDELHTFDGAQGTDLAVLIRRLRDRLNLSDSLACVGTSATVGRDTEALLKYASQVFGTTFDAEAVIGEDRLSVEEFLPAEGEYEPVGQWPDENFAYIDATRGVGPYLSEVVEQWFGSFAGFDGGEITEEDRLELARQLPRLEGFRRLLKSLKGVTKIEAIASEWLSDPLIQWESLPEEREERLTLVTRMVESLLALISVARVKTADGALIPFLNVRSQLWIRELARAVVTVGREPRMALAADVPDLENPLAMPLIGCRECNRAAWGGIVTGNINSADAHVTPDLKLFYESWFSGGGDSRLFYPIANIEEYQDLIAKDVVQKAEYKRKSQVYVLCPCCHKLAPTYAKTPEEIFSMECSCGCDDTVPVWAPDLTAFAKTSDGVQSKKRVNRCPHCLASGGLRIFGGSNAALTSSALAHMNASAFSEDHKVIAFSDSVQDAALRAGFITARNYLSVVRHAAVNYLSTLAASQSVQLTQVLKEVVTKLFERAKDAFAGHPEADILARAQVVATFMPPDRQWMQSWRVFAKAAEGTVVHRTANRDGEWIDQEETKASEAALVETYPQWQELFDWVKERLVWEILVEFGYRTLKGRSVTRIGAATLESGKRLDRTARELCDELKKENIEATPKTVQYFLNGVLDMMKTLGAFDSTDLANFAPRVAASFGEYLATGNDWKAFNSAMTVLPRFGQFNNPPNSVQLIKKGGKGKFFNPVLHTDSSPVTWFESWAEKLFNVAGDKDRILNLFNNNVIEDVYKATFEALEKAKLVTPVDRDDKLLSWVLTTKNYKVTTRVSRWKCTLCGRLFTAAESESANWQGSPCLSTECQGHLEKDETREGVAESAFFAAPPVRINAREHTGLVDGDTRSRIEKSFGGSNAAWSVNLLSATPTLEMGIDIGALSTVMQCSMPPRVANHLQRIGRAGRRDGNALALTVANRDAHSQYFWTQPEEMLKGEVTPPGVFLRAVSVLERQLLAFAITRWVSRTEPTPVMKRTIGDVLSAMRGAGCDFPVKFLEYVTDHAEGLWSDFCRFFETDGKTELTDEAKVSLHKFVAGDAAGERLSLAERVRSVFEEAKLADEARRRDHKALKAAKAKLEKAPVSPQRDSELADLTQQIDALKQLWVSQNNRPVFQFLTDEGLLPNYAFPEEGVTVNSVILRQKEGKTDGSGKGRYLPLKFSFSRGAAQAMRELAPNSLFYTNAHILRVDQVRLTEDSVQTWRFCPCCTQSEPVADGKPAGACPSCGCEQYADSGNVKTVLRMKELIAHCNDRDDRISDDKDTRATDGSSRLLLLSSDAASRVCAWRIDDPRLGFGFEFLKSVTIRELNFGQRQLSQPFEVAGAKVSGEGFKVCRSCGMVWQPPRNDQNVVQHDYSCPHRGKPDEESHWYNGLFLFREMKSEAIRIRVPVSSLIDGPGAEKGTQSLIAAIELGLRKHFGGSVDHLSVAVQTAPSATETEGRDTFIVIYDTIPGGSGYLKDLMRIDETTKRPEQMKKMLREAYDVVTQCACASVPGKDGCYHCVYRYRDFGRRSLISRQEAENILRDIVTCPEEKFVVTTDLANIRADNVNVLEARFVKRIESTPSLKIYRNPTKDGRTAYDIEVKLTSNAREAWKSVLGRDPGDTFTWRFLLQVDVTEKEGATCASRPDFTIRPKTESVIAAHPELVSHIFTDGWNPHCGLLADDTRKRQAILNLGHRVWSFTWEDLAEYSEDDRRNGKAAPAYAHELLDSADRQKVGTSWNMAFNREQLAASDGSSSWATAAADEVLGSASRPARVFDWLIDWICDPFAASRKMAAAVQYAVLAQTPGRKTDGRVARPLVQLAQNASMAGWMMPRAALPFDAAWCLVRAAGDKYFTLATSLRIDEVSYGMKDALADGKLHGAWQRFWQLANLTQFAGRLWCLTRGNESDDCYDVEAPAPAAQPADAYDDHYAAWRSLARDYSDYGDDFAPCVELIQQLIDARIPACDDCSDGVGSPLSSAEGFLWKRGARTVYLFAAKTLLPDVAPPAPDDATVVIVADDKNEWLNDLRQTLGL